jgi:uncharacterized protein YbaP (TraB family)
MTTRGRGFVATVLAACALLLAPAWAWAKPPVWTVHGRGATITLFGSVHILSRDLDWRPEALTAALAEADELWFETPIDDAAVLDISRQALAKGLLPEDRNLAEMLSARGRTRLRRAETDLHLPGPALERLRPWLAELTIADADYAREGATAEEGVERQLSTAAPQASRHSFETAAQQIALFSGQPEAVQVSSLEDTLRDLQDDPDQARRLIDAWMKGDLKAIEKEGLQPLRRDSPQMFKALLTDRNAAWLKVLSERLGVPAADGSPARIVVVVGVGHLVGPGGVPALLRARGFRVDGPKE